MATLSSVTASESAKGFRSAKEVRDKAGALFASRFCSICLIFADCPDASGSLQNAAHSTDQHFTDELHMANFSFELHRLQASSNPGQENVVQVKLSWKNLDAFSVRTHNALELCGVIIG